MGIQGLYDVWGTQREPARPWPQQGERFREFGKEAVDMKSVLTSEVLVQLPAQAYQNLASRVISFKK